MSESWKPEKNIACITIEIEVIRFQRVYGISYEQTDREMKATVNRIIEQVKRHVDLEGASVRERETEYEYVCPICGKSYETEQEMSHTEDDVDLENGELYWWVGMPRCCKKASYKWGLENPHKDETLFAWWKKYMEEKYNLALPTE